MHPLTEIIKGKCESSLLFFTRYLFKENTGSKFEVAEFHKTLADTLEQVYNGEINRLIINIPPRYGKTEIAVKMYICWVLAKNPRAKFIHLSYSDSLALDNSSQAMEYIKSDAFKSIWPINYVMLHTLVLMVVKNYKFKTKPYAHQLKALEMSWNKEVFAYFMEMGTGKSKVLLDNIAMLYDKGKINGVLIVAPKGVYKNWYSSEIPTHLPDHIEKVSVLWQANITKQQQQNLKLLGCDSGEHSSRKLAEIIAAAALGLEISLGSAIMSHTWTSAHMKYGRK